MRWEGARVGSTGALRETSTWLAGRRNCSTGAEGVTSTLFEGLDAVTLLSISSDLAVSISIATVFEALESLTPSFPASPIAVASGALLIG